MIFFLTESWILIFITITILRQNHELICRALIYLRLYDSVAKQIKQGSESGLQTDGLLVRNQGETLKVQLIGIHFKWNLQNSKKVRSNHLKKADQLLIYFYVLNQVKKSICFFYGKVRFTSYVNYYWKSNKKKVFIIFVQIEKVFIIVFCKIKFTSYANYFLKIKSKKSVYYFFAKLNLLVM